MKIRLIKTMEFGEVIYVIQVKYFWFGDWVRETGDKHLERAQEYYEFIRNKLIREKNKSMEILLQEKI